MLRQRLSDSKWGCRMRALIEKARRHLQQVADGSKVVHRQDVQGDGVSSRWKPHEHPMKRPAPFRPSAFDLLCGASLLASLAFLVMWPFGYRLYTSFGIDADRVDDAFVTQTHYRLRWPGDGSFMVGANEFRHPKSKPLERFDLGGAFFRAPRKPTPQSGWNRMGFWLIRKGHQDKAEPWSLWLGVPSWLPPLLTGLLPAWWWMRRRRNLRRHPEVD